ncbi:MAG: bifunctional metallophosphatase/5'-nucleotidase [Blautia sp.]|nr:bifunctional metallophosphatase/5'-nucleotidase [Blautia sp.]
MKKLLALALSALLVLGAVPAYAEEEAAEGLTKDLVILITSDVHCGVDQNFTLAGLAEIREAYEEAGNYTLLVDDGDFIQGEALGTTTEGEALVELMNEIGYDIAIPGNHEFDYGMDRLLELHELMDFDYISCNIHKDDEPLFDPYVIKEFDGVKIAFLGITTPETITSSTPTYFQDEDGNFIYDFSQGEDGSKLYATVQETVDAAREAGADYVFAMCHLGNEEACRPYTYADVIANTSGIDALFDGHSHDTDQVVMKNKEGKEIIRTAVGTKLACIGTVTLATDGTISSNLLSWNLPMDAITAYDIDNEVEEAIDDAKEELDDLLNDTVGTAIADLRITDPAQKDSNGQPIRIVRRAETNLGDLCADSVRYAGNADVSIFNGGGCRADLSAGEITGYDILKVNPFNNAICVAEVTGQQILDALEWGCRVVPEESGGFPQVSGMTYEIHTYLDSSVTQDENGMYTGVEGEYRVKNVKVGDEPLDLEKTYRLAATNYLLLSAGDGYAMFTGDEVVEEDIAIDHQALMNYIREVLGGEIGEEYADPYGQGRIVAVEEAPAEGAEEKAEEGDAEAAPAAEEAQEAAPATEKVQEAVETPAVEAAADTPEEEAPAAEEQNAEELPVEEDEREGIPIEGLDENGMPIEEEADQELEELVVEEEEEEAEEDNLEASEEILNIVGE